MRVVKKKLSDSVLEEIGRMVKTGELKRGDKLPLKISLQLSSV